MSLSKYALLGLVFVTAEDCSEPLPVQYYVDCESGSDTNDGLSESTPWGSLQAINEKVLHPGDEVLLKRGTQCMGSLRPVGEGTAESPIFLGAYGDGARPVIDATGHEQALYLEDQGGWTIESIEFHGSHLYGIFIGSSSGTLTDINLTNLYVHDVVGDELTTKESGLVVFTSWKRGRFERVRVDGVYAHTSNQWAGIFFYGADYDSNVEKSSDIVIRNSTVHDVYGDGIVLFAAQDSVIETSVAFSIGLQPEESVGTPNAIWTWYCDRCVVQYNEGYDTHSPGIDGGVYDIDWGTNSNTVQYNYGHDADSYCVAIFGAEDYTTTEAVVRYNVCLNNGREDGAGGDIQIITWTGGSIDGVEIYNNTFFWQPAESSGPVFYDYGNYEGNREQVFKNNIIHSSSPWMVDTSGEFIFDNNLYYSIQVGELQFSENNRRIITDTHESFDDWQGTGQDAQSLVADPLLAGNGSGGVNDMQLTASSPAINMGDNTLQSGACDYWGQLVSDGAADIGAHEFAGVASEGCQP